MLMRNSVVKMNFHIDINKNLKFLKINFKNKLINIYIIILYSYILILFRLQVDNDNVVKRLSVIFQSPMLVLIPIHVLVLPFPIVWLDVNVVQKYLNHL